MVRFLLRRMILRQYIPIPITIYILNPGTGVGTGKGKLDDFCLSGLEEHVKVVTAVSRRWLYLLDSFLVILDKILPLSAAISLFLAAVGINSNCLLTR